MDTYTRGRRRRRSSSPPTDRRQMAPVGRDHIRIEIRHHWRAAQLATQPVSEGAVDRRVLPPGSCRGGARSDPLGLPEQIALRKSLSSERRTDHDTSIGVPLPHQRDPIKDLDGLNHLLTGGQLELQLGHA